MGKSKNKKTKKDWNEAQNVEDYGSDSHVYYTKETHEKVCKFVHDDSLKRHQRDRIYQNYIYPAFDEMIRIMINTYNFNYTGTDIESLVQEVNVKMYDVLETSRIEDKYYDESYGSSYSYFSRVCKNYLIQKQSKNQMRRNKYGMDSINDDESYYNETLYHEETDINLSEFIEFLCKWMENNIDVIFDKQEDINVAYSILDIIRNDSFEINNPKMFFYAMKHQVGDDDYRINKVKNILRDHYIALKNEYLDNYDVDTKKITIWDGDVE